MSTKYDKMLPDYLAGFLDDKQTTEIEKQLLTDAELQAELKAIEISLEKYAQATASRPNSDISQDIWNRIYSPIFDSEDLNPATLNDASPFHEIGGFFTSYIGIAASVLLLASMLGNLYLASEVQYQKNNFISTLNEKNRLQSTIREVEASKELFAQEVSLLKKPNMKVCKLISNNTAQPSSLLLAIDMEQEMQVKVMSPDLPEKPAGYSYQLWAIGSDGQMVCMGTFDSEKKIYTMKKLPFSPKEFGVTVEEGLLGKPQPTSDFLVRGI